MSRYLTPNEKRAELAAWRSLCEQGRFTRDGEDEGGCGYPDASIVPWCDRLNALPGVCTLQSCAGHPGGECGHLWLRLSEPMRAAFDRHALRLAAHTALIERVAIEYAPWGKEIAAIAFAGNDRDSLHRSMRLILAFFRSLRAKASEA